MFNTKTFYALRVSLDGLARRQEAIAGNIANVDTPGYRSTTVEFEEVLDMALSESATAAGRASKLWASPATWRYKTSDAVRPDGNTVDIDLEMAELAETQLRYDAAAQLLAKKYAGLRRVITEGKG